MQEIGPRFTLKLRWVKKGLPAVKNIGEVAKGLEFDTFEMSEREEKGRPAEPADEEAPSGVAEDVQMAAEEPAKKVLPPSEDEYQWIWKVSRSARVPFQLAADNVHSRSWRRRGGRSSCSALHMPPKFILIPPQHCIRPHRIEDSSGIIQRLIPGRCITATFSRTEPEPGKSLSGRMRGRHT